MKFNLTCHSVVETLYWGLPFDAFIIGILVSVSLVVTGTVLIPQMLPFLNSKITKLDRHKHV